MTASADLRVTPDGEHVVYRRGSAVAITELDSGAEILTPVEGLRSVWAAADEVWALSVGDEVRLHRLERGGDAIAEPKALLIDPSPQLGLVGARAGDSVVVSGPSPLAVRLDCGELITEALRPAPTFACPLDSDSWLYEIDGVLGRLAGGEAERLAAAPALEPGTAMRAACLLNQGKDLAIAFTGEASGIWILDARRGEIRRRIAVADGFEIAFAPVRQHALVLGGDRLQVIDLRFGKSIVEWRSEPPLRQVVAGAGGTIAAALRDSGEDVELVWIEYRELLRPRQELGWRGAAAPAEVDPEPEPQIIAAPKTALPLAVDGGNPGLLAMPPAQPPPEPEVDLEALAERSRPKALPETLAALVPKKLPPVSRGDEALRQLERQLALVGAWCYRAIAEAWDSGRIAFDSSELPFEHEVAALLGSISGRASERLTAARAEVEVLAMQHDQAVDAELRACAGAPRSQPISPLVALAHDLGLSRVAIDILLVIAAPMVWGEMARLYGICANDEDRPLCDEWLITQLLAGRAGRRQIAAELEPGAPLRRLGVVQMGQGRRPFAELSVHPLVIQRLYGEDFTGACGDRWVCPADEQTPYDQLLLAGDVDDVVASLERPWTRGALRLVVRGKLGSGRTALLAALARAAGRRLGLIDAAILARSGQLASELDEALRRCLLRGWLPCLVGASEAASQPDAGGAIRDAIGDFPAPVTLREGSDGVAPIEPGYLQIDLQPLDEGGRRLAWRRALADAGLPVSPAARLASTFVFGPGVVRRVVELVDCAAGRENIDPIDLGEALEHGVRQYRSARMGELATRIDRLATWSQVCLPPEVLDSVREFIGRVRHRHTVYDRWGFDALMSSSRGLVALFEGRPGTGKTMVAGVIARELGCDLYRIDLSKILSKWVGETEKRLADVFDAAEGGQLILLFDEADSLLSRRTEVKSSNDRFANIEVNYLLQRLDSFEGIAVLTTNFGRSIDPALKRRLSLRLSFPFPDEELRARLWRAHLPKELPRERDLDLDTLAEKYPLSGGYIRNIALRAAFLAAHECRPLSQGHLERAITLEYRATGKLSVGGTLE